MALAPASLGSPEKYVIEIVSGPDKGAQFQVFAGDIKIGRADTNDIVLNDVRCSREHAVLKITSQAIFIEDLNSSTGVIVDGQKTPRAFISNGSKIMVGSTTFMFKKVVNKSSSVDGATAILKQNNQVQNIFASIGKDPKKLRFYGVIGVVGLIVAGLLSMQTSAKKDVAKPLTSDEEIESSQKRQALMLKEQMQSGKASRQYLDAQASYTKGLRDYREGLYKSAVSSFSATLAIYPEHPTAKRYLRLSQLKLDEQIQFLVQEGNRFMDQEKYQNAKASFSQTMLLVGDPENKIYQEAKEKYNECVLILRESF